MKNLIKVSLALLIMALMAISISANAQPTDPSGDPDSVRHSPPGDPSDPDLPKDDKFGVMLSAFPKELVCDSVQVAHQSGKTFVILYYRGKRVAIYRKQAKLKKGEAEFY